MISLPLSDILSSKERVELIMIEQDTIRLLRECDAGVKIGISSIDEVFDYVQDDKLRKCLSDCKSEHCSAFISIQNCKDISLNHGKSRCNFVIV